MSTAPVQVGDVWKDKDKRRNTVIEILKVMHDEDGGATGLVVGTEEERSYSVDRLVKRWELVTRKDDIVILPAGRDPWTVKGSAQAVAKPAHVHNDRGECIKNRGGQRCNEAPKAEPKVVGLPPGTAAPKNWHLKMQCSVNGDKGQAFRITMKQLESFGAPLCGCHQKPMLLVEKH